MGNLRREIHVLVFVLVFLHISLVKGSDLQGLQPIRRPGRKLLQCTTEAACRARCPPGNNIIYLSPQDGSSGQCVCICSPTSSQQNATPSTRSSAGLVGSNLGGSGSFAQPLTGGGGGGVATGGQSGASTPNSDTSGTAGGSGTGSTAQNSGTGSGGGGTVTSASQQVSSSGSNLVGSVQSSGSSSDTTTATLVNSATGGGSAGSGGGTTSSRSARTPPQSG